MNKVLTPLLLGVILLGNVRSVQASEITAIKNYQRLLEAREPSFEWCTDFLSAYDRLPNSVRPDCLIDDMSEEDLELLVRVVSAEISGDKYTFSQKVNVAAVILYRWRDADYPAMKKICTKDQFGCVASGAYARIEIDEEALAACEYAFWFGGEFNEAYFFNSTRTWDGVKDYLGYDGAHYYYRKD